MGLTGLRPDSGNKESSKHCDHKFQKKLQFYAKVKATVASLHAKKAITKKKRLRSRQKKLKAYDLSSLLESLPESKGERQQPPAANLKLNAKSRQKLVVKEGNDLLKFLEGAAFQLDPLSAIHQRLLERQPEVNKLEKSSSRTGKKKAKKKLSKAGAQSMDL